MATSHHRGHRVIYVDEAWRYTDTLGPINIERPCMRCGRMPTEEGYDACLGYVPGAVSICCGHGVIVGFNVMTEKEGEDMEEYIIAILKEYMKALEMEGKEFDGLPPMIGHLVIARVISGGAKELGAYLEDNTQAIRELEERIGKSGVKSGEGEPRADERDGGEVDLTRLMMMDLILAGTDADGDYFPQETLEEMVKEFKRTEATVPVTMGFKSDEEVGYVKALTMEGCVVVATIVVDDPLKLPDDVAQYELAAGGQGGGYDNIAGGRRVERFELMEVALTKEKIHRKELVEIEMESTEPDGEQGLGEKVVELQKYLVEEWPEWIEQGPGDYIDVTMKLLKFYKVHLLAGNEKSPKPEDEAEEKPWPSLDDEQAHQVIEKLREFLEYEWPEKIPSRDEDVVGIAIGLLKGYKALISAKEEKEPEGTDTKHQTLRERLAALEHDGWSRWMRWMLSNMHDENFEQWRRQMYMPYEQLPEDQKEWGRDEADDVIELLKSFEQEQKREPNEFRIADCTSCPFREYEQNGTPFCRFATKDIDGEKEFPIWCPLPLSIVVKPAT